jgi:hypothetical protein
MSETLRTVRRSEQLQELDMIKLGGVLYIVDRIDDTDEDYRVITASQLVGRNTWSVTLTIPNDVPFHANL